MEELEMKLKEIQEQEENVEETMKNLKHEIAKLTKQDIDTWDIEDTYYNMKETLRELWRRETTIENAISILKGEEPEW